MAEIMKVKCDFCGHEQNLRNNPLAPTFFRLYYGGSDFEMSMTSEEDKFVDFCSAKCLYLFIIKSYAEYFNPKDKIGGEATSKNDNETETKISRNE